MTDELSQDESVQVQLSMELPHELPVAEYRVPEQRELESKAIQFLRDTDSKRLKAMSRKELDLYTKNAADAARAYAENLIASGEFPPAAWNRAIRLEILESESD